MIVAVVIAIGFAAGVEPRRLALLAGSIYLPFVVAGLVAIHWYRTRSDESSRPSLFCEGVSAELRAGATLRSALGTSAVSVGCEPLPLDSSIDDISIRLAEYFPVVSDELRLTVLTAARTGSDSAALFDEIGSLALAQAEISHEVRVAIAPGRATALILVAAPVLYVGSRLGSEGLSAYVSSPEQRLVALIGLGLFVAGLMAASLVLWRAAQ
jgi:Flp pilus assembly protein TadB